ncbi:rCG48078 [Rattus norvegicus]|uniref:RCG48078 n=1 Tax=Rattus norvegicus TaxID=10116 RepID=A6I166_RAT|nr:rCG48078 [Rattus norvegicus]
MGAGEKVRLIPLPQWVPGAAFLFHGILKRFSL